MAGNLSVFLVFAAAICPAYVVFCSFPATLTLERIFPVSRWTELDQLRDRDRVRHGRLLQSSIGALVDFPVGGTFDPFLVGLYFTRVKLGTPAVEFNVQIDTGSDVLWVSCKSCNGCPQSSGLHVQLNFFDPGSSSTSSSLSCSDQRCSIGVQSSDSICSSQNDQCAYSFQYGDGSGTSGYYISDIFHLDDIIGTSTPSNTSASIVFGCSTSESGDLTKTDRAVDGIFGLGQQGMSIISQLSSQGVTPKVFSHCLKGDKGGGGVLVFGEIVDPAIVYTPLVTSQPHYNLNLQSIAVNGQILPIDSEVFATSNNRGTIIDSGTTLAYLAEEAYDPFVNSISKFVSQSPLPSKGNECFLVSMRIADIFPTVSFNFAGGASMLLKPKDYLILKNSVADDAKLWCIGFQKITGHAITILGDLVLKDKIFVYDLEGQRIGWADYDCSKSVNVTTSTNSGQNEIVDAGQINHSRNSSPRNGFRKALWNVELLAMLLIFLTL